ncbi:MAG: hypothetical protein WCC55_05290, partial [Nitrosotalea sp.]
MKDVFPIHYDIEFEPDFKKFIFKGKEKISIKVSRLTSKIILHAVELEVKKCNISWNGREIKPKIQLDAKTEELT